MRNNSRRWWKRALILVSGPIVMTIGILAVFAVFQSSSPEKEWREDVETVQSDLFQSYTRPQFRTIDVDEERRCTKRVKPSDGGDQCDALVDALSKGRDDLTTAISRLDALAKTAPAGIPAQDLEKVQAIAGQLRTLSMSDDLLVKGWTQQDDVIWHQGWELRAEALPSTSFEPTS